jgi:hypothetical protein
VRWYGDMSVCTKGGRSLRLRATGPAHVESVRSAAAGRARTSAAPAAPRTCGRRRPARLSAAFLLAAFTLLLAPAASPAQLSGPCALPVTNEIACENTKAGTPESVWGIDGAGDPSIQGFATSISVNRGATVSFKIKSATSNYKINIYRLGWYGGDGARLMASNLTPSNTAAQPACLTDASSGLIDCGNWSVSRAWTVPTTAVSGVYIAHLIRNDTGGASHITFIVRNDESSSDVVLQTSDSTWVAYNTYGGNSLYKCTVACPPGNPDGYKAAYKVSYNRPFNSAEDDVGGRSFLWWSEYPMIRFLERSGYNMTYTTNADVHRRGSLLRNHRLYIASGHDEYWSQTQRSNVEAARDAGVNLAFFTGNEIFWKTRWEPSISAGAAADRTIVSYKDTHFTKQEDPVEWTGTWRDPRFTTDANRPVPENALTGQSFLVNAGTSHITVPEPYGKLRLWRDTAAATLLPGQSRALAPSTLGFEWDEDADNGFRPPGQFRLSQTTVTGLQVFVDYGSFVTEGGTATHHLTSYRAPSGALVFGSGTVQWSWGLDAYAGNTPDRVMQQATLNLFADMGAQPYTVLAGLVRATKSTDTTKPTSSISAPLAGATLSDGAAVTITGTAVDSGGGRVAGVEVSTDGGQTWRPATTGTTSWTYSWVAHGSPSTTIRTRATDDSGNIETPGSGRTVNVTCPCSIWGNGFTPPKPDSGDPNGAELGVKFKSTQYGTISGVRFYKSAANTGTHVGSLWTTSGTRLAQATFTNETASGWQTVTFSQPVQVEPGETYVASYHAPNGRFAASAEYLYADPAPGPNGGAVRDGPPLHALRNTLTESNGLYAYSSTNTFPANSHRASNYFVDVVFTPTPPPGAVTGVSATSGGLSSANVTWSAPTTGGGPRSYVITPHVNGVAQTAKTITGNPPLTTTTVTGLTGGTTYTFTVRACNPAGCGATSPPSNQVTPGQPVVPAAPTGVDARPATTSARVAWTEPSSDGDSPITGYTVTPYAGTTAQPSTTVGASTTATTITGLTNGTTYTFRVKATNAIGDSPQSQPSGAVTPRNTVLDLATPPVPDVSDSNAVELGMKFTASVNASVTGVRFFKSVGNTGTHVGNLWTATGTRLAQVTFTNETASGWQTALFASPVSISAGTTYVVSYHAPFGRYSAGPEGLSSAIANGPLTAPSSSSSGGNGVYAYGATSTFPSGTYNATNYFVDALVAIPPPGAPSNVSAAAAGRTSATVSWTAPADAALVTSYRVTPYVGSTAQPATTVTGSPPSTSTNVTGLTNGTTYTFRVAACNSSGCSADAGPSNSVTPDQPVAPTAPTGVDARAASSSARVSWSVPSGDGDSPITSYTVTPYAGTTAQPSTTVSASTTATTITGLTNGTAYTFRVKATNAIGDSPQSQPSGAVTPRFTLFDFATPDVIDAGDSNAVNLGVKFTVAESGSITGVRFYKSAQNTGTHVGSLWTQGGTRLAQVTFTDETANGWQTATFSSPVSVSAGTTYVASYHAPNGRYSVSSQGLSSTVTNGPLTAPSSGSSGGNGVYAYGPTPAFPSNSFNATNYHVDVNYASAPPPGAPTGVTATAGQRSATVSWTAPTTGGAPTSYTVTPRIDGVAQTPKTITGTPPATSTTVTDLTAGTAYTFTVRAANGGGTGPESAPSGAVTPTAAAPPGAPTGVTARADTKSANVSWSAPATDGGSAITSYTVVPYIGAAAQSGTTVGASATATRITGLTNGTSYTFRVLATNAAGDGPQSNASGAVVPKHSLFDLATPATEDSGDGAGVNLGVKFSSDVAGSVAGIRFYKSAANTGTHVGSLWTQGGTLLAQATFTGESASGWQTVTFSTPVAITAGTTYVASYHAPNGRYSVTRAQFGTTGVDNPPLRAPSNALTPNGLYAYGSSTAFPQSSFDGSNYWVDVLFDAAAP